MPRTFSSRTTHPVGGSPAAQGGLWYDLPIDGFNCRDSGVYVNEFIRDNDYNATDWPSANLGTPDGSVSRTDVSAAFGVLAITGGSSDTDGFNVTGSVAGVLPAAGRVIAAEFRVTMSTWVGSHFFFGLSEAAALDINGTLGGAIELVGFHVDHDVTTTGIPVLSAAGGNNTVITYTPTSPIPTLTNNTFYNFGIRIEDTTRVYFYFNGTRVGGGTLASAYTARIFPAFSVVANGAVSHTLRCDYVTVGTSR